MLADLTVVQPTRFRVVSFDGDVRPAGDGLTPATTLAEFFAIAGRTCLEERGASHRNVAQYAETVRYWSVGTGDPPIGRIDRTTIAAFRRWLETLPGRRGRTISPNTVAKHLVTIKAVLRWAAPRGPGNEDAYTKHGLFGTDADGDLRYPPPIHLPPRRSRTPDPFSLQQIAAWMRSCEVAESPRLPGVAPADWWRALITFSYNVGTRIETTLALTRQMVRGNWLVIPAEAVKGRRRELRIWCNAFARRAAGAIVGDSPRLFPWPYRIGWLMKEQHRIVAASEVPLGERYGGTHRLRKALATWLTAHNPAVARMQLGHSLAGDVLLGHYADPRIVADLMERVPQPDFPWPEAVDDRQMRLF